MKLVSIITVNYNHSKVTEELLASIAENNTYPNLEIIVVDNASRDSPIVRWQQEYPHVIFIQSTQNLGFAGGNNLGIQQAKGDYLFLINNDTEITPTLIPALVRTMEEAPAIGILSPKIMYFDQPDVIQYAGYTPMNYLTGRNHCIGQYEKDIKQFDHQVHQTGYAHGAAMMVRTDAVKKAGVMAENFFLYYEELDWCERIRKAGYEVWVNLDARIYHKESQSVGKRSALKEYYMNRNRILFVRKHASYFTYLLFLIYFTFLATPKMLLSYLRNGERSFFRLPFLAIWWNLTNSENSNSLYFPRSN